MKSAQEKGRVSRLDFVAMFKEMATRFEIHFLLIRFANKDFFTVDDFKQFLECEQGVMSNHSFLRHNHPPQELITLACTLYYYLKDICVRVGLCVRTDNSDNRSSLQWIG